VFRRGFLSKVSRTSVLEHYGLRTLMYGVLLPGPDIGVQAAAPMRAARDAGFECGIHAWDHVAWHDGVRTADDAWTGREWTLAATRFADVFGSPARVSGAAGWQINAMTVRLQAASGIAYASDGRGPRPYRIAIGGEPVGPPQYPTTLPTIDELLGRDGLDTANVHTHLLALTRDADPDLPQVFTLHAELEGQKLLPVLERLLAGWRDQGWSLVALGDVHQAWQGRTLPAQPLRWGEVPGRSGELVVSA
jgi:peptidoglycan/xylan/chitin deacetylase (PgdA/CDA1 family)